MLKFITEGNFIRIKDGDNDFRLLHKTSNCINWTVTDKIDLSIDEVTFDQLEPSGISFEGVAASNADGVINSLKGMFTGLQAAKVYRALLTQSGTDAPVATILENTVGNIVITRDNIGVYNFTLSNAFTQQKTWLALTPYYPTSAGSPTSCFYNFARLSVDYLQLVIGDGNTAGYKELSDFLIPISIEILVYP
jgi:hypothetical protein